MFEAFPLWAQARSGRNSALFHVEHFPIRLQFPKCSTWNNTLHHPSNSDPQTRLLPSIRSENPGGHLPRLRFRPLLQHHHYPAGRFPASSSRIADPSLPLPIGRGPSLNRSHLPRPQPPKNPSTNAPFSPQPPTPTSSAFSSVSSQVSRPSGNLRRQDRLHRFRRGKLLSPSCPSQPDCPGRFSQGRRLTVSLGNQPGPLRNRPSHPRTGCRRKRLRPPDVRLIGSRHPGRQ